MRLEIGGREILPGFITAQDFFGSPERNLSISDVFVSVRAFADGGASFAAGFVGLVLAATTVFSRKHDYKHAVLIWATVLSMILFLFFVPNRHHRMAAFPLGLALPFFVIRCPNPLLLLIMFINLAGASLYLIKGILLNSPVFIWTPWSSALCLLILGFAGLLWLSFRQQLAKAFLLPGLGILTAFSILSIATLLPGYEERRFSTWEVHWGNQRARNKDLQIQSDRADWARCWSRSAKLTEANGAVVAYSGSNLPYPLRGKNLRNEILSIPVTIDCKDPYFDWGHDTYKALSDPDSSLWLQRLQDHSVEVLCVFREEDGPWPREMDWALSSQDFFELHWRCEHAAVFSVNPHDPDWRPRREIHVAASED
jgi:hypothetical protein